jgi:integrase/recombinase XerD
MSVTNQCSQRLGLPLQAWPLADRRAWAKARRKGNVFAKTGWAAEWSSASVTNFCWRYGRWLQWVITHDPQAADLPPADRVTPDRIAKYLAQLSDAKLSDGTRHGYVQLLLTGMEGIAPKKDWRWLNTIATNLRSSMKPSVDKRLQVRPSRELYAYGVELMNEADKSDTMSRHERANQYRDGLLVAIFASRAPRRGVVALMEIGTHLMRDGDRFWMIFGHKEMKGRRDSSKYLPNALTPYIDRYLDCHRRVLLRDPDRRSEVKDLWIGKLGQVMNGRAIYSVVCSRTLAKFGIAISPHRFRDSLATSFAYEDPANLPAASVVLDHTDPRTIEKHYNQAQSNVSLKRIHVNLDELREQLKPIFLRGRQKADGTSDDKVVL